MVGICLMFEKQREIERLYPVLYADIREDVDVLIIGDKDFLPRYTSRY